MTNTLRAATRTRYDAAEQWSIQKCRMDSTDAVAFDLRGNVMTCQKIDAKGVHKIGHVTDF